MLRRQSAAKGRTPTATDFGLVPEAIRATNRGPGATCSRSDVLLGGSVGRDRLTANFGDANGNVRVENICAQNFVELLLDLLHAHP